MDGWQMVNWVKRYEVLANRVGMINEILGCRYHHDRRNPMVIVMCDDGSYDVRFYGDSLVGFRMYDDDGLEDAISVVDVWQDCLWQCARKGRIKRVDLQEYDMAV